MTTFIEPDLENPVGEQKRVVAALKSFGARNAANVNRSVVPYLYGEIPVVEIRWVSAGGEFKDRQWTVSVLLQEDMTSPREVVVVEVTGSDGKWYFYEVPYRTFNRFLSQRLGNDHVPWLFKNHKDYWIDVGGYKVDDYVTVPTWAQWGLGAFEFHKLKREVAKLLEPGGFLPEESLDKEMVGRV